MADIPVSGYEIHMGETTGPDRDRSWLCLDGGIIDGAQSADGRVTGCYLHGLFGSDPFRSAYLSAIVNRDRNSTIDFEAGIDAALDELADHVGACLDLDGLLALAQSRSG
jgi:adenosylcobyric acid synthase